MSPVTSDIGGFAPNAMLNQHETAIKYVARGLRA